MLLFWTIKTRNYGNIYKIKTWKLKSILVYIGTSDLWMTKGSEILEIRNDAQGYVELYYRCPVDEMEGEYRHFKSFSEHDTYRDDGTHKFVGCCDGNFYFEIIKK